jgi:hypothetical protein
MALFAGRPLRSGQLCLRLRYVLNPIAPAARFRCTRMQLHNPRATLEQWPNSFGGNLAYNEVARRAQVSGILTHHRSPVDQEREAHRKASANRCRPQREIDEAVNENHR